MGIDVLMRESFVHTGMYYLFYACVLVVVLKNRYIINPYGAEILQNI